MLSTFMGMSIANSRLLLQAVIANAMVKRKKDRQQKNPVGSMARQITHRQYRRGVKSASGKPLMWRP